MTDTNDDTDPLDEARKRLDEVGGRPPAVGKMVLQERAKLEHEREMHRKAQEKLEVAHKMGVERRNEVRTEKLEAETKALQEKERRTLTKMGKGDTKHL